MGVGQVDAVGAGVGDLLQVVAVGADVETLENLVRGSGVEVDGLAGLGGVIAGVDGRRVVGGVPEIVDAPAGLEALGGIEGHRVVGIEGPGVVADVDWTLGRVATGGGIDVEIGALVDGHAEEGVLGPLKDDGSEDGRAHSLPDAVAAGVDVRAGEHDFGPVPGTEKARVWRDPRDMEQRRSGVDVGDPGDALAGIAEGLVIVFALADVLDEPAGEGDAIEEAGVAEVHGGERRLLLCPTEGAQQQQEQAAGGNQPATVCHRAAAWRAAVAALRRTTSERRRSRELSMKSRVGWSRKASSWNLV